MSLDLIKLSKTVSHALRHEPGSYNLTLDKEGWVNISDLLISLKNKGWGNVNHDDLILMIDKSEKKRYQILNDKIRAYYGHSTDVKILKQQQVPPQVLYHGTSSNKVNSILKNGLLPMRRQYVHLSEDITTAEIVANRRAGEIKILVIQAINAYYNGVAFYKEENGVWLSEHVPPKFIQA
jgi:putative RNA 2'-phosphotransferase